MRPGPSLQRWRGRGPEGWPSLRWWSDWDAGALGEEWALCAAPQGFPMEEQEDAGCGRLLGKADECGPSKGTERSRKPGLPPCHPEEEWHQGEGHFVTVDAK